MRETTKWSLHFITGAIIVIVLGIHLMVMHLDYLLFQLGIGDKEVLSHASVYHRARMLFHVVVYLILLGAALYHGLYGFRSILFELPLGSTLEKAISIVITIFGFLLFIYGAQAIIIGYIL